MEISNLVNWALGEGWALVVFGGIYFLFDQHKKSNGELAELQEEKNTLKKQVADLEKQITKKTDVIKSARVQLANATSDLSLRNTSFGVLKPRHFLGRLFNLSMMSTTS